MFKTTIKLAWQKRPTLCMVFAVFVFLFLAILPIFFPGPPLDENDHLLGLTIGIVGLVSVGVISVCLPALLIGYRLKEKGSATDRNDP
jgi:hypothetical protein